MRITISANLGNPVTINNEGCSLFINESDWFEPEETYDYILKNLYISTQQFSMLDKIPKARQKRKVK
jgi:hypothetical protein